jgi:hypothetical protein
MRSMGNVRITLGVAVCLTTFVTGCLTSGAPVGQVQEVGPGIYSIGVSGSHGLGGMSREKTVLEAAVDKAGEYCHSKGQKLLITNATASVITFRCPSDDVATQKPQAPANAVKLTPPTAR